MRQVLSVTAKLVVRDSDERKLQNPRPYFRLLLNLLLDLNSPDPASLMDTSNFQVRPRDPWEMP